MASPLEQPELLARVLAACGPGQYLYLASVSTTWRHTYFAIHHTTAGVTSTSYRHAVTSTSRLHQALACGLAAPLLCDARSDMPQRQVPKALSEAVGSHAPETVVRWALDNQKGLWIKNPFLCTGAAKAGRLPLLQLLRQRGLPWYAQLVAEAAAANGDLAMLQWAYHEPAGRWEPTRAVLHAAVASGNLALLQWLADSGLLADMDLCTAAARAGRFEALRWLRERAHGWDADTLRAAARRGHAPTLEWLLAGGCPLTRGHRYTSAATLVLEAARGGSIDALKLLRARALGQWNGEAVKSLAAAAAASGHLDAAQWLLAQAPLAAEAAVGGA